MAPTNRSVRPARVGVAAILGLLPLTAISGSEPSAAMGATGCVDTTDAIAWWSGDDTTLSVVGPNAAGSPAYADAVVGRGFALDGSTRVEASGVAAVGDSVTVEAWIRPDQIATTQSIVSRWDFPSADDGARAYSLLLDPFGRLTWSVDEVSARRPVVLRASVPQLFDGQFHHVAATRDGAEMVLYVDGVAVASTASPGRQINPAAAVPTGLGSEPAPGVPFFFSGVLDEPTIWSRALTATEVGTIHANGSSGKCFVDPVEQAKLTAFDGAFLDRFGSWVDIDGDTAVVGSFQDDGSRGSAYVYRFDGAVWNVEQKITAQDAAGGDLFGVSVAIDGDVVVIGAHLNDDAGSASGSAYVFTRSGTTWTQQQKLVAADAAAEDRFGFALDIDGDTIVVGARDDDDLGISSGAAYVFRADAGTWVQEAKLTPSDGAELDFFGRTVAVSGDTVAVGAHQDDDAGTNSGSAYVFTRSGTTWSEEQKLVAADAAAGDQFGYSVDVSGSTLVVGAYGDADAGAETGAAYVFQRAGTWSQTGKVVPPDAAAGDWFGGVVAIQGSVIAVASQLDDDLGADSGAVYLVANVGAGWAVQEKVTASDGAAFDTFGLSLGISATGLIVGSLDDDLGTNSGAAYVFSL